MARGCDELSADRVIRRRLAYAESNCAPMIITSAAPVSEQPAPPLCPRNACPRGRRRSSPRPAAAPPSPAGTLCRHRPSPLLQLQLPRLFLFLFRFRFLLLFLLLFLILLLFLFLILLLRRLRLRLRNGPPGRIRCMPRRRRGL